MQIHNLAQGSPEWKAYRNTKRNASDAPAMAGCSPYKTRSQLVHEVFTGITADVDERTQALFDRGHEIEELKRSVAEEILGEELFPAVASEGIYSASFDGITMLEEDIWECKSLNDALRAALPNAGPDDNDAANLPKMYRVQLEQQCMVSGCKRGLFTASDGNNDDRHCWYYPDEELRAEIVAGWAQFEKDLAEYVPREIAEKPKADAILALPALVVQIRGEVANSNLPVFKASAETFIARINADLKTDEDFAVAEATVKFCKEAEDNIDMAKNAAIAQTASIDELMRTLDHIQAQLRDKRLTLNKLVTTQKEVIKTGILSKAKLAFAEHVAALESEIKPIRLVYATPDFAGAMKNKRTLASLHDAVDSEMANAKIGTDAIAKDYRAKLAWCKLNAEGYGFLFMDMQQIIVKAEEDFKLVVKTRIAEHKKAEDEKLEAERAKIAAEEKAKAEAKAIAEPQPIQTQLQSHVTVESRAELQTAAVQSVAALLPTTPPTLRLGMVCERLGFGVTADFMVSIGFSPAATDKSAKLYHESDFPRICQAIAQHAVAVGNSFGAQEAA